MKKRSFLAIMMAGLLFASCDKTNEPNNNVGSGELETSYIAVSVNSVFDPAMRAADDYEDGTQAEQKVTTAHFFFFDANGAPFTLNSTTLGQENAELNYIKRGIEDSGSEVDPNVETITNVVLTIEKETGDYPTQMVVVLNWNYSGAAIALEALNKTLIAAANYKSDDGFLMSNSVYAKTVEGQLTLVNATPITIENIAKTAELAKATPVNVYVERVAAKVTVKEQTIQNYNTQVTANGKQVYAKIVGWDINTTMNDSYLVKQIDIANYKDEQLGFTWNDAPYHRSYWATSANTSLATAFSWKSLTNESGLYDYCLENTTSTPTKVVIAAQLVDENGESLEIARLYSEYYTTDAIKALVATALKDQYYYQKDENTKESILPEHIAFVAAGQNGQESYSVKYTLTDAAKALTWFYSEHADNNFEEITANGVIEKLGTLEGAQIWNGMSYYTVDIEHLGNNEITNYAVVRNHSYVITVEGIKGLGTPVYDPDNNVVTPTEPEETSSYVAARINVLSWRIVNQNVTLQ